MPETKTIAMQKGTEWFVYRYEEGCEAEVLDALVEAVRRRDLDPFDFGVLRYQLGRTEKKVPHVAAR